MAVSRSRSPRRLYGRHSGRGNHARARLPTQQPASSRARAPVGPLRAEREVRHAGFRGSRRWSRSPVCLLGGVCGPYSTLPARSAKGDPPQLEHRGPNFSAKGPARSPPKLTKPPLRHEGCSSCSPAPHARGILAPGRGEQVDDALTAAPELIPLPGAEIPNDARAGLPAVDPPTRYRCQISHASTSALRRQPGQRS